MNLLGIITIRGASGKRVELYHGDLTTLDPDQGFDMLVVSAFPDDYLPTPRSLIGALHRKGLSVTNLAAAKEIDLRSNFSCWLSRKFKPPRDDLRFGRVLCFEPLYRGDPPSVVGDIFRALTPILAEKQEIRTIAMPIVAAGDQGYSVAQMLEPLLDAAIHWMQHGLPLDVLKIVAYSNRQADEAKKTFGEKAKAYTEADVQSSKALNDFDVFISYAHEDAAATQMFEAALLRADPAIKIFLDRKSIDIGVAWQPEIFESIDRCRKLVAMFSPHYLASKVCKEEFNIAWARGRETDQEIIFPVYLYSANLPTYMKYRNYLDCREGDRAKIEAAPGKLLRSLASGAT